MRTVIMHCASHGIRDRVHISKFLAVSILSAQLFAGAVSGPVKAAETPFLVTKEQAIACNLYPSMPANEVPPATPVPDNLAGTQEVCLVNNVGPDYLPKTSEGIEARSNLLAIIAARENSSLPPAPTYQSGPSPTGAAVAGLIVGGILGALLFHRPVVRQEETIIVHRHFEGY